MTQFPNAGRYWKAYIDHEVSAIIVLYIPSSMLSLCLSFVLHFSSNKELFGRVILKNQHIWVIVVERGNNIHSYCKKSARLVLNWIIVILLKCARKRYCDGIVKLPYYGYVMEFINAHNWSGSDIST